MTIEVSNKPYAVATGDLDDDGDLDLAVAMHAPEEFNDPHIDRLAILMTKADGTIATATTYPIPVGKVARMRDVDIADLNADARQDIVLATNKGISVLLGHGDGTLGSEISYAGTDAVSISIGDTNNDGRPDIVAAGNRHGIVAIDNTTPPAVELRALQHTITDAGLDAGTTSSLTAILEDAAGRAEDNLYTSACDKITAFVQRVTALGHSKEIPVRRANSWTTAAHQIQVTLGCLQ